MRGTFGHLSVGALLFLIDDTSLRVSTLQQYLYCEVLHKDVCLRTHAPSS